MKTGWAIEPVSPENITYLVRLVLKLWEESDYEEELDYYSKLILSADNCIYLVKADAKYIAFIHLSVRTNYVEGSDELPVAYVEAIYVEPDFQHQGIGKQMIVFAESWAKERKLQQLASDTNAANIEAIMFHKKVGFKKVETIICFIKNLDG